MLRILVMYPIAVLHVCAVNCLVLSVDDLFLLGNAHAKLSIVA